MNDFYSKRVCSLVVIILLFFVAKAQAEFRPGYIITLQGDTVNGFIDLRSDKANARAVVFKEVTGLEKRTYTPDQIKSYRFDNGKYYLSGFSLDYEMEDQVFLEYVVKGSVSILYYQDDVKDHFFIAKDSSIIKLDNHDRLSGNAEKDVLILSKPARFKAQLKLLFNDQPVLYEQIDKMDCYTKDLVGLVKAYFELSCSSPTCIQYEKKTGGDVKIKFGMLVSGGLSHLSSPPYNMYISDYDETKYLNFGPAFTYEIGTAINLYFDYSGRNRYSMQLSPTLGFVEYKSNEERTISPLLYVYKLDVKYTTLKIPLLLKRSFYCSNRSILPYLKLGPGVAVYLSQKGNYTYYSVPVSDPTRETTVYRKSLNQASKPACAYIMAGAGTDIKYGNKLIAVGATYAYGKGQLEGFRSDIQFQMEFQF